jgi:hypothetical protein
MDGSVGHSRQAMAFHNQGLLGGSPHTCRGIGFGYREDAAPWRDKSSLAEGRGQAAARPCAPTAAERTNSTHRKRHEMDGCLPGEGSSFKPTGRPNRTGQPPRASRPGTPPRVA